MPNKGSTASNKKNKRTRQRPKKPASIATAVVSHVNDNGKAILEIDGQQKPFKLSKRQSNKFQLEENNRLIVIFKPVKHGLEVIVSEKYDDKPPSFLVKYAGPEKKKRCKKRYYSKQNGTLSMLRALLHIELIMQSHQFLSPIQLFPLHIEPKLHEHIVEECFQPRY